MAWLFYYVPLGVAYITAFYMFRLVILTFFGQPRDDHVFHHAKEHGVPWVMKIALIVLAVGAIVAGWGGQKLPVIGLHAPDMMFLGWIDSTRPTGSWGPEVSHAAHAAIAWPAGLAWLAGLALALVIYRRGFVIADSIRKAIWPVYEFVHNKFYFDELYNVVIVRLALIGCYVSDFWDKWVVDGLVNLAALVARSVASLSGVFDNRVIDGSANGLASVTWKAGTAFRLPQTGRIRNYVLFMVLMVALAVGVIVTLALYHNGV
jgi:NADH-quinone oxidoreductase subunit L